MQLLAHPPIADTAEEGALERVEHDMDVEAGVTQLWVTASVGNAVTFLRAGQKGGCGALDHDWILSLST